LRVGQAGVVEVNFTKLPTAILGYVPTFFNHPDGHKLPLFGPVSISFLEIGK
jgi:hypothetical protein